MSEDKEFHEMYDRLMSYENAVHEKNQKRIKIGIKCIWIVPLVFLSLLFITGSNKIVFLVLWIASLFGIAAYLIWIEFIDYELQKKINEIGGKSEPEFEVLIPTDNVAIAEEHLAAAQEKVEEHIAAAAETVNEKKAAVHQIIDKRRNSDD